MHAKAVKVAEEVYREIDTPPPFSHREYDSVKRMVAAEMARRINITGEQMRVMIEAQRRIAEAKEVLRGTIYAVIDESSR